MVKNNFGGNKSKGFARKNMVKSTTRLRLAKEEGEIYAQAVKVMGGNIASVIDIYGNPLRAHIRGKFRGRGKHDNFIGPGTWLLVGLHNWQDKSGDIKDCDILEVYGETDKTRLKNSVTNIDWNKFVTNDSKTTDDKDELGIEFADESTHEYQQLIASLTNNTTTKTIITDEEVDVDDI
jgi:translation initiation factor IF-1